jgi:hypothetical protein
MSLDEDERAYLVETYHRKKRIKVPNLKLHAIFHVVVENQIALGDAVPARKALARLMGQGLSRHDAVHTISSVLASHIFDLMKHGSASADPNADYNRQLENLNAEDWLKSMDEESEKD